MADKKAKPKSNKPCKDPDESGQAAKGLIHPEQQKAEIEQDRSTIEPDPGRPEHPTEAPGDQEGQVSAKAATSAFPIICIGASAGGLEAIESFVSSLPAESGLAFVVITHTDPEHTSLLPELIRRKSKPAVQLITEGMAAAVDTIYIPPSDSDPVIEGGRFHLVKRTDRSKMRMPIDLFCRLLAKEQGEHCGCVILSGTGTDGTQGLRFIKEKAGLVMAQDPKSAQHTGMPVSAADTGLVDYVLNPSEMAARLIEYFKHPAAIKIDSGHKQTKEPDYLRRILAFLAQRTRHDFSFYKNSTLVRRVERRIAVTRSKDASGYLTFLHQNPSEARALFQDLLIGVTNFFRDPESFDFLKQQVLLDAISRSREGEALRVWVPGCSTGEEAFSIAIILKECLEETNVHREMYIFATDIDPRAIEKARQGAYPPNIASDVSEQRLERFFTRTGDQYHVKREIRDPVIFAEQNILRDPPFSNLDLLVCRNLLIYLKPEAQNKLLPLFHYTLKNKGVLFLGPSESVGRFPELFQPLSKSHSIYQKRDSATRPQVDFPTGVRELSGRSSTAGPEKGMLNNQTHNASIAQAVENELLEQYTPTCIVVNPSGEIVHIHGRTGKYLEPAPGKFSPQIAEMAREGLRYALASALRRVRDNRGETIHESGLRIKINGGYHRVDLTVSAIDRPPLNDCLMVVLQDLPGQPEATASTGKNPQAGPETDKIEGLEQELMHVTQDYRGALEELETSNEELKSTNEEMHSANEELQSTNEELESSREELQSLNEELSTVNAELQSKIIELNQSYNAITDALNSTRIAVLFLNTELKVRRFTQEAARLINLIDSDVGRPIDHISNTLDFEDLPGKTRQVLQTLRTIEEEVRTKNGEWYRMSMQVHRTLENVIEGVVLTFINIDVQKRAQQELEATFRKQIESTEQFAESIFDTVRESLLVLDLKIRVVKANRSFYKAFHTGPEQTIGRSLFELGEGRWDIDTLRRQLHRIIDEDRAFEDLLIEIAVEDAGTQKMHLNARKLHQAPDKESKILLAIEHVFQDARKEKE